MEVRMKKLLLSLCLIMITPVVLADAQQEAMEATFAAATDSSIDTVFEIYQTYYDPVDDETYSIVGYDSLEDIVFKDNLVVNRTGFVGDFYKVTLLYGDPDIPRIYKGCDVYITAKNGKTTYSKINPKECM